MKRTAKWFLACVIVFDLIILVSFLSGELSTTWAQSSAPPEKPTPVNPDNPWSTEALTALGKALKERQQALDTREQELVELARGQEILAEAGETPAQEAPAEPATEAPVEPAEPAQAAPTEATPQPTGEAFQRLSRAYAAMEPDSAANALAKLAERDQRAVVQLLIDWQPRTSGAILDALTLRDAALAAELSYEIWKLSGKATPAEGE